MRLPEQCKECDFKTNLPLCHPAPKAVERNPNSNGWTLLNIKGMQIRKTAWERYVKAFARASRHETLLRPPPCA